MTPRLWVLENEDELVVEGRTCGLGRRWQGRYGRLRMGRLPRRRSWPVSGIGLAAKAHQWPQGDVTRAVAGALSVLDPGSAVVTGAIAYMEAAKERYRELLSQRERLR